MDHEARSTRWPAPWPAFLLLLLLLVLAVPAATAAPVSDPRSPDHQQTAAAEPRPAVRPSAEVPAGTEVSVLVKNIEPFIFGQSGEPTGFSADIWNEIADRNGWVTRYEWTTSVADQIAAVSDEEVDAAIAAISMTPEREKDIDFSLRMFSSGLQIMTQPGQPGLWDVIWGSALTRQLLRAFTVIFVIILVIGHVVWLVFRHREDWPKGYVRGVGEGMWRIGSNLFAASHSTKVFVQQGEPSRLVPRILTVAWMAVALVITSYVVGTITSSLTVAEFRRGITSPGELSSARVVTVERTQAAAWLSESGIGHVGVDNVDEAIDALVARRSDAFVFDSPILKYELRKRPDAGLAVVGELFDLVPYGIALQKGSNLREQVNATLLDMYTDGTYERIQATWFD